MSLKINAQTNIEVKNSNAEQDKVLNELLIKVAEALDKKSISINEIYQNPQFQVLLYDPESRKQLRSLIKKAAPIGNINIINKEEPGISLEINGLIVDNNNIPVEGVLFYFFAVDNQGLYAPEAIRPGYGSDNPRLFGYVKTDQNGKFNILTINPSSYIGIQNIRHIHYALTLKDGNQKIGEFIFSENPTPSQKQYDWAKRVGFQIIDQVLIDDKYHCDIVIEI